MPATNYEAQQSWKCSILWSSSHMERAWRMGFNIERKREAKIQPWVEKPFRKWNLQFQPPQLTSSGCETHYPAEHLQNPWPIKPRKKQMVVLSLFSDVVCCTAINKWTEVVSSIMTDEFYCFWVTCFEMELTQGIELPCNHGVKKNNLKHCIIIYCLL